MPNLAKQECTVLFNVVVNDERYAERTFHRFVLSGSGWSATENMVCGAGRY